MSRLPSLDGLRACAVILVFLAHAGLEHWVPGGLGVTVFFVMSGYLITGLLRLEHRKTGHVNLLRFYERRAVRLMPPLLVVVSVAGVLAACGFLNERFTPGGLAAALFYFSNYHLILHDFHGVPAGLGVLWSLAVEEHFYLLFPLWLAWVLPAFERRHRADIQYSPGLTRHANAIGERLLDPAVVGLLGVCLGILAWRCWLQWQGINPRWLLMATDTRADAILAGCILGLIRHPQLDERRHHDPIRDVTLALAFLAILVATLLWRAEGFRHTWRYTLQAAALAPLIHLAVTRAHWRTLRWLNARPLVWLGHRSYGVYLVHHVVLLGLAREWPNASAWHRGMVGVAVTLVFAALLHSLVEQPFTAWVRHRRGERHGPSNATARETSTELPPQRERVSVCIATFRRPEKLALLLDDLARQQRLPDEVVVVDNDPAESARVVVEARQGSATPYDLVYALQPQQNISLTRNRSVELARGEWLAFVDDDERAPANWLERLLACTRLHHADGALGPVIPQLPPTAPPWVRRGRFHEWARMPTGGVVPANRLRFGNVLLNRLCLRRERGPFDPALGLTGGEDGDLLNRLRLGGARLVWCDEAVVEEPVDPSRLKFRWLWLRALRGGQDFARHYLHGRYGVPTRLRTTAFFLRAAVQLLLSMVLAIAAIGLGRHRTAFWLFRAAGNLGKLSLLAGWHYREYAGARA